MSPFGSARADRVVVSAGLIHTATISTTTAEEEQTITTLFPSTTLTIPVRRISVLTGIFVEKEGRISLFETGTYQDSLDLRTDFRRETTIHSVPVLVSGEITPRLILSAGILISFLDINERTEIDFDSGEYSDAEDVTDLAAAGESFMVGALLDLGPVRVAGLYRGQTNPSGELERSNEESGVWSKTDVDLESESSYRLGLRLSPAPWLGFEVDYETSPWRKMEIGGELLGDTEVARLSAGLEYRGEFLWNARKYPILFGYYTQHLDWSSDSFGEINERVFSIGTSIPVLRDRAAVYVGFEIGRRQTDRASDFEETFYGVSLAVSAAEFWRREIDR
jgi:hypothetical protein